MGHTGHAPAAPMILGPARWSVLHGERLDALSFSPAYNAVTNVSGDSLALAKIGFCDLVASLVTSGIVGPAD